MSYHGKFQTFKKLTIIRFSSILEDLINEMQFLGEGLDHYICYTQT